MAAKPKTAKKTVSKKSVLKKSVARKKAAKKRAASPGMSDAAVKAKTGKTWAQWFALLDKAGAAAMSHKDITALLSARHKLADWWSQMVTVGYERVRGLRALHQKADGFSTSVSRTLAAGLDQLFEVWDDARTRGAFLKEAVVMSTRNPGKNLRFAWERDGGRVEVRFVAKGPEKAQVTIDHSGLASGAAVTRMKTFWADALARVGETALKASKNVRGSGGRGK
jgi:hypothetical protein